jgi:formate dehydrogenase maturation protein FdhE
VADPTARPAPRGRTDTRETAELRAIKERQPELADAVNMHIDILDLHRRIQNRVPLPWFELTAEVMASHQASGRPMLRFEDIPLELTDLRLMVRQTAELLRRHGTLEENDYQKVQSLGRDMALLTLAGEWYRARADRPGAPRGEESMLDQVLLLAMRPFLSRCAEVLQQRSDLATIWTHPYCALCGGEPDFAVITPQAERHLICSRCTLRWKFEALTCPYCRNDNRGLITSFATPDGKYRVYACDACHRYLKAYDGRRATRPVMVMVDSVATLPLDAAAIQRGYNG